MCSSLFLCLAPPLSLYILFLLLILIAAGKCCWPSVQSIGQVSSSVLRISSLHMGKLYGSRWLKWVTTTFGGSCHRKCRKAAAALTSCSCWAMCRHLKLSVGFFDDDRKRENIIPQIFFLLSHNLSSCWSLIIRHAYKVREEDAMGVLY